MKLNNNFKIHAFDGSFFWVSEKNKIYKVESLNSLSDREQEISVPNRYVKHISALFNRLFRTGIHNVFPTKKGFIVLVNKKFLIYENSKLRKIINIPRGSRPLRNGVLISKNNLYFGDYWRNADQKKSNVYKLNLHSYEIVKILSLSVRHIHFIVSKKDSDSLIIGTGDFDKDCKIFQYNLETDEINVIGSGFQKYRAVSILQHNDMLIWGSDDPNGKNHIYSFNLITKEEKMLRQIDGPAYYSSIDKNGYLYIATTIESKHKHRCIIYKSANGFDWEESKEFMKDFLNEKYFGYGIVEFINGQELLEELRYNLINLYER